MSFLEGLITGGANSLNTGIRRDMDRREKKIDEIAKLRASSIIEESGKHATQFKDTESAIRKYAGLVDNDMELVQYAVEKYGLEEAGSFLEKLNTASQNSGGTLSVSDMVNIDRDPKADISANQITKLVVGKTPTIKALTPSEQTKSLGFMGFFDDDYSDNINKYSNELVAATNLDTNFVNTDNISSLSPISSTGEKTWLINAPVDPAKRLDYFERVTTAFIKKYSSFTDKSSPEAVKALELAREVKNSWDVESNLQSVDSQPASMTNPQVLTLERKLVGDIGVSLYAEGESSYDPSGYPVVKITDSGQANVVNQLSRHISSELYRASNTKNDQGATVSTSLSEIRNVIMENLENGMVTTLEIDSGDFNRPPMITGFITKPLVEVYPAAKEIFTVFYGKLSSKLTEKIVPEEPENIVTDDLSADSLTFSDFITQANKLGGGTGSRVEKQKYVQKIIDEMKMGKIMTRNGMPVTIDQVIKMFDQSMQLNK